MKVIITGASGMVGRGVLLECLDHPAVTHVLTVNRRPLNIPHPKLKELILNDFNTPHLIKSELRGYDAVFYCLGVSAGGMNPERYKEITYDYTLRFAKEALEQNPDIRFIYVSGIGTNEQGRMAWAKVKGKTESDLLSLGFSKAYMYRPGMIRPLRGIRSRTKHYQMMYSLISPFWPLIERLMGDNLTDTRRLGKSMIQLIMQGSESKYFYNKDINKLAE